MSTRLVDVDISIRIIESELPVDAETDLEAMRQGLQDWLVNRDTRNFTEAATVVATVVVREV